MSAGKSSPEPVPADIIYDWNELQPRPKPTHAFDFHDETLRDGLQSPSVSDPSIEDKLELLERMNQIGVRSADIGLPGAGKRAFDDVVAQTRHIVKKGLRIEPQAAARTLIADVRPVVEASQRAGAKLGVYAFIGSSPIRQWAEEWDLDFIEKTSIETIDFAVKEGLDVAYVTEDTTRTPPRSLERLFTTAIDHGAKRLVLCDTVGHATPAGVRALVTWTRDLVTRSGASVKIDWHGHNDRGLAVPNAIAALESGAQRIHACGLGVGERVGNTSLDLLLLNLKLMGWIDWDLSGLVPYVNKVAMATRFAIPLNYPLSGADAFRTATGVHAAAIVKAKRRGNDWLADRVYSGVPAGEFGRGQQIEIGHMSGMSNVRYWFEERQLEASDALCREVLQAAKSCAWTLSEREILALARKHAKGGAAPSRKAAEKKKKTRPLKAGKKGARGARA
jgi:2-isopropylmalate synthase